MEHGDDQVVAKEDKAVMGRGRGRGVRGRMSGSIGSGGEKIYMYRNTL